MKQHRFAGLTILNQAEIVKDIWKGVENGQCKAKQACIWPVLGIFLLEHFHSWAPFFIVHLLG